MKCSFCNAEIVEGTGKIFVKNSGEILYFCCRKCERYYTMGRKREKLKWVRKNQ
ncbi:MAG: 50S ribosomal protein L24 [Candidatus Aenigmarchaeota archaeon]|nr:50S ribosomal protein L24 [Candidatus Aenigmarchaeota archaeon]MCX8190799.1 50S ribosomal protein L24 [Candidatus Aenigmarchaeota archaeon]MDW8160046.1 50S ribosomal protein L24 [Candidatus Aenigmarchaeota archaeon]